MSARRALDAALVHFEDPSEAHHHHSRPWRGRRAGAQLFEEGGAAGSTSRGTVARMHVRDAQANGE